MSSKRDYDMKRFDSPRFQKGNFFTSRRSDFRLDESRFYKKESNVSNESQNKAKNESQKKASIPSSQLLSYIVSLSSNESKPLEKFNDVANVIFL